jgi:hypothetical protein
VNHQGQHHPDGTELEIPRELALDGVFAPPFSAWAEQYTRSSHEEGPNEMNTRAAQRTSTDGVA